MDSLRCRGRNRSLPCLVDAPVVRSMNLLPAPLGLGPRPSSASRPFAKAPRLSTFGQAVQPSRAFQAASRQEPAGSPPAVQGSPWIQYSWGTFAKSSAANLSFLLKAAPLASTAPANSALPPTISPTLAEAAPRLAWNGCVLATRRSTARHGPASRHAMNTVF